MRGAGDDEDGSARPTSVRARIVTGLALAYVVFITWSAATGGLPSYAQRAVHVAFALALVYATRPSRSRTLDAALAAAALASTGWVAWSYERLFTSVLPPGAVDLVLGAVAIVVVLEACRRAVDLLLPLLALLFVAYALTGPELPGVLRHVGFRPATVIETVYLGNQGFWGPLSGLAAGVISAFIIFGAALAVTGAGRTFIELAVLIAGRLTGGPAQVAVLSSAFFGTISGSAVANVVTTGTFTIPMMKRTGYSPPFAAAVEATASTGGQIAPPIMGAGAFVMAEILGVPYTTVLVAAIFPALLYYAGTAAGIYFHACRAGLGGLDPSEIPSWRSVLRAEKIVCLAAPLGVLLYLMFGGFTPTFSAWTASLVALGAKLVFAAGAGADARRRLLRDLGENLRGAGTTIADITVLVATASVMVAMIGMTGLGIRVSELMLAQGTGTLDVALATIGACVMALLLGTALPTVPAYLISAAVLATPVIKLGFAPLAVHMFIFYYSVMGVITPPLCAAVWMASSIADAPWRTAARYAMTLATGGLIAPFLFLFHPHLLLQSATASGVLVDATTAVLGVVALSAAVFGHLLGPLGWIGRLALIACSLLMILPNLAASVVGLGVFATMLGRDLLSRRREATDHAA